MENYLLIRLTLAIILAFGLAFHGLKKRSLSPSGCVAAMIVGFVTFSISYRFGLVLILFYYSSSKLTKLKEEVKAKLEDGHQEGGQRDWIQVFSCSILAVLVAVLFYLVIGEDVNLSYIPSTTETGIATMTSSPIIIDLPWIGPVVVDVVSRDYLAMQLTAMFIAHFATANGDTWASEVGILSPSRPRLISTFFTREVPPGTNGGMSVIGTVASAAGGGFIGLVYYLLSFSYPGSASQWKMILFGIVCGLLGSIIDSLLGATLQVSYYSERKQRIVKTPPASWEDNEDKIMILCGCDCLSNEAVNFLSIGLTMVVSWYIAPIIL
eukprot:scaffold3873_cov177-Ochromonas_danica.AAC.18